MFKRLLNKLTKKTYENIIIFIFEDNEFIENRLELIRFYNPNIKIYGICTTNIDLNKYSKYLENIFIPTKIYNDDKNDDLYLIEWFKSNTILFESVYIIKWDTLIFKKLSEYPTSSNSIYLTSINNIKKIDKKLNWILTDSFYDEKIELFKILKKKYNYNDDLFFFESCFYILSFNFLKKYSLEKIPHLLNSSFRIPLFAKCFKYNIKALNNCFINDNISLSKLHLKKISHVEIIHSFKGNYSTQFDSHEYSYLEKDIFKFFSSKRKRNLVISSIGKNSLHKSWIDNKENKNFDLILFYYDNEDYENFLNDSDLFIIKKGFKFNLIYELFKEYPNLHDLYDFFWFPDDDIETDTKTINQLFSLMKKHNFFICQPSLSEKSYVNWDVTAKVEKNYLRFVRMVEVMCPVFNSYSLKKCIKTFPESLSTYGLDCAWSSILGYPKNKIVIFDNISVTHTRPYKKGQLYINLEKIGIDHQKDLNYMLKKYNADMNFINYKFVENVSQIPETLT
jgi:hypothetical protein